MHVNTFKRIEIIIHGLLSSTFLEAIKAMVHSVMVSLQNPANIIECPLSYTV